jgi:hypothetical protein
MKQHSLPVRIVNGEAESLEKVPLDSKEYNEEWIQDVCFTNPSMLPIAEVEPTFSDMVPICKELPTKSGAMDLVFINEHGFIAIGECKLWRNPEARRKVIGQILEYAKDLSSWSYEDFEKKCLKARKDPHAQSLYDIVSAYSPEVDVTSFIDAVQRNLQKGRFVLLIIGDGIRESMESLSDFIQHYGNMNFTLTLIELPIYKIPSSQEIIITPRIIAKTKEIERIIFHVSDGTDQPTYKEAIISRTISEKVFFERLELGIGKKGTDKVQKLIKRLGDELNVYPKFGRGKKPSLNLKSADETYNFASIQETGEVWFFGIVNKTEELGNKEIGYTYLKKLANLLGGYVDDTTQPFQWSVRKKGKKFYSITDFLKHENDWVSIIAETLEKIRKAEELNE